MFCIRRNFVNHFTSSRILPSIHGENLALAALPKKCTYSSQCPRNHAKLKLPSSSKFGNRLLCPTSGLDTEFPSLRLFSTSLTFRNENDSGEKRHPHLPKLMDHANIAFPSVGIMIKTWLMTNLIIKPFMDTAFNIKDFMNGAKQALLHLSSLLASGKLNEIEGLVTNEAYHEICRNYTLMGAAQREKLRITENDIYFSFPFEVGVIMPDSNSRRRYIEITTVFHIFHGYRKYSEHDPFEIMKVVDKHSSNLMVYNVRFIRDYTKGVDSDWCVNVLNCFYVEDTNR